MPPQPASGTTPPDVPVQSYAAIDLSGNSVSGADVSFVALDDQNNAGFGYSDDVGNSYAYNWSNGSATPTITLTPYRISFDEPDGSTLGAAVNYNPRGVTPSGGMFGSYEVQSDNITSSGSFDGLYDIYYAFSPAQLGDRPQSGGTEILQILTTIVTHFLLALEAFR